MGALFAQPSECQSFTERSSKYQGILHSRWAQHKGGELAEGPCQQFPFMRCIRFGDVAWSAGKRKHSVEIDCPFVRFGRLGVWTVLSGLQGSSSLSSYFLCWL